MEQNAIMFKTKMPKIQVKLLTVLRIAFIH